MDVATWTNKVKTLIQTLDNAKGEYEEVLNNWESVRDQAANSGKGDVDDAFKMLHEARAELFALRGGQRKSRKQRKQNKTRKH
jgi:ribosomal 50S subunit-associated protein YjgA (DUF615 family)